MLKIWKIQIGGDARIPGNRKTQPLFQIPVRDQYSNGHQRIDAPVRCLDVGRQPAGQIPGITAEHYPQGHQPTSTRPSANLLQREAHTCPRPF